MPNYPATFDPWDEITRLNAIEAAAIRVVQLVDHGADSLAVGGAIAALRRVLDGET